VLEPSLGQHAPAFQCSLVPLGIEGGCHWCAGHNAVWRKANSEKLTEKTLTATATRTPFANQFVADSVTV
jgi:hypothetical protein